jgi:hypothetical protein
MISEEKLKEITKLADSVPEKYQVECFELLLEYELSDLGIPNQIPQSRVQNILETDTKQKTISILFKIPISVSAFLNQYNLDERKILDLFHIDGDSIVPIYKIKNKTSKKSAQIELSLLLAFENALKTGKFGFQMTELRDRCTEEKCYDYTNFKTYLKQAIKNYNTVEKEETLLTPDGKSELANILAEHIK